MSRKGLDVAEKKLRLPSIPYENRRGLGLPNTAHQYQQAQPNADEAAEAAFCEVVRKNVRLVN